MSDDHDAAGAMSFVFEAGVLKRAARTGWWFAGVKHPESIAEHSFRTGLIGMMLAAMEGADPARVSMLCLLHDTQETRITDIPHIAKRYLTAAPNTAVTADQVAACPPAVADVITAAVAEYEAGESLEAVVARDADKLECLVQAVEYRHQGVDNVQRWIDSSRRGAQDHIRPPPRRRRTQRTTPRLAQSTPTAGVVRNSPVVGGRRAAVTSVRFRTTAERPLPFPGTGL